MRQSRTGYAIANGVVAGCWSRSNRHHDFAVIDDDSDVFQTDVFNVGHHTYGAQYDVTCDGFLAFLVLILTTCSLPFDSTPKTSDEVMTLMLDFLKLFRVLLTSLSSIGRPVLVLNYGHFGADSVIEGKFHRWRGTRNDHAWAGPSGSSPRGSR